MQRLTVLKIHNNKHIIPFKKNYNWFMYCFSILFSKRSLLQIYLLFFASPWVQDRQSSMIVTVHLINKVD